MATRSLYPPRSSRRHLPPSASDAELSLDDGRQGGAVRPRQDSGPPGERGVQVRDLTVADDLGTVAVDAVSLDVKAGEILGIAGVQGNGQNEFVRGVVGAAPRPLRDFSVPAGTSLSSPSGRPARRRRLHP